MSKELKSEIVDAVKGAANAFLREHGSPATAVYITQDIKQKIERLTSDEIGALSGEIWLKGAPAVMTQILGLKIKSWDSDIIKVE